MDEKTKTYKQVAWELTAAKLEIKQQKEKSQQLSRDKRIKLFMTCAALCASISALSAYHFYLKNSLSPFRSSAITPLPKVITPTPVTFSPYYLEKPEHNCDGLIMVLDGQQECLNLND